MFDNCDEEVTAKGAQMIFGNRDRLGSHFPSPSQIVEKGQWRQP